MKDNIERIFKESLENYAMPYNGAAWDALSKKLDAAPPAPFYKKWWFAASIAVVAAAAGIITVFSTDTVKAPENALASAEKQTVNPAVSVSESRKGTQTPGESLSPVTENTGASNGNTIKTPEGQTLISVVNDVKTIDYIFNKPSDNPANSGTKYISPGKINPQPANDYAELNLPKTICLNDELEIFNSNKEELIIVTHPNGNHIGIKAGAKSAVKANTAGTLKVVSGTNSYTVEVVRPESSLNIIQVSDSPYENGVPEIRLEANGGDNVTWATNASSSSQKGKTLIVHPFREMEFDVTAISKDAQGCTVTEKQTIRLEKRYNLLAENVIHPSSNIPRNRVFMPEALKIRDVAFELSIIDPKTGNVVYETSDAAQGWDGTDMKNGESARANSIWLWKVVIKNPMVGEPRVYNGTLQVVENK